MSRYPRSNAVAAVVSRAPVICSASIAAVAQVARCRGMRYKGSQMSRAQVSSRNVMLPHPALPLADWADSWQVDVTGKYLDARSAAKAFVTAFPKWTRPLLLLRTILVLPFGLKGRGNPKSDRVGFFPVVSERPDQLVAGFDDKHLDFRIVVDLEHLGPAQRVSLTTVITRHNALGRIYLAIVLPFHRAIIKSALKHIG
ncbi:MAG: DUF2867 domain-containing protein [Aestuariivirga sp.]